MTMNTETTKAAYRPSIPNVANPLELLARKLLQAHDAMRDAALLCPGNAALQASLVQQAKWCQAELRSTLDRISHGAGRRAQDPQPGPAVADEGALAISQLSWLDAQGDVQIQHFEQVFGGGAIVEILDRDDEVIGTGPTLGAALADAMGKG
ncbi:MAG: hypothetical protein C0423_14020 [Methylibium sp.]|nr:hypothetical protein [Methylibium sp.]